MTATIPMTAGEVYALQQEVFTARVLCGRGHVKRFTALECWPVRALDPNVILYVDVEDLHDLRNSIAALTFQMQIDKRIHDFKKLSRLRAQHCPQKTRKLCREIRDHVEINKRTIAFIRVKIGEGR